MALKGERHIVVDDTTSILGTVAEAGQIVIFKSSQPSGSGLGAGIGDNAVHLDVVSGSPSGVKPYGMLLCDMVDIDESALQHRNYGKLQQLLGEPAYVLRQGWAVTDKITGTPACGDAAYISTNSTVGPTQVNSIAAVGQFLTAKDADGYAKVQITLA